MFKLAAYRTRIVWLLAILIVIVYVAYPRSPEPYPQVAALLQEGINAIDIGRYEEALRLLEKARKTALELKDKVGLARTLDRIGGIYDYLGQPQKALEYYKQALQLSRETQDRIGEAATLNNIGGAYGNLGDLQKAREFLEQALQLSRENKDRMNEAGTLNKIGQIYDAYGHRKKALEYHEQALQLSRELKDKRGQVRILNDIGGIYDYLGQPQKALEYDKQALQLSRETQDRFGEANILCDIGGRYWSTGHAHKALEYYEQALQLSRELKDKRGQERTLWGVGLIYEDLRDLQKALEYYKQALQLSREAQHRIGEAAMLNQIGGIYSKFGDLQKAREFLEQALQLFEAIERRIIEPTQVGAFQETHEFNLYAYYAFVLLQLKRPTEAFAVADRGRGQGLARVAMQNRVDLPALLSVDASIWQNANNELLTREQTVREAEEKYRNALTAEMKGTYQQQLLNARTYLHEVEGRLILLRERLARNHPDFARISDSNPLNYLQLESGLLSKPNDSTLFLEYTVVDDKTTLLFALSRKDGLKPFVIPVHRYILGLLTYAWLQDIADNSADEPLQACQLYDILILPLKSAGLLVPGRYTRLVVVGDGPLLDIPFAALRNAQGKRLAQDYSISTAFSLAMLTWPENPRKPEGSLLAAANPPVEADPLPRAEEQAREMLAWFPEAKGLLGPQATKAGMLQWMGKYALLHFGTHGYANNRNGLYSYLMFAANKGQDGNLYAREIAQQPLSARLAVLSACETMQGEKIGGEGLMGLAWAFRAAGCPSVVASLWRVAEGPTASLMRHFYRNLLQGQRKDDAMRAAMLAVQQEPGHDAPKDWAAFQVIGTTEPLSLSAMKTAEAAQSGRAVPGGSRLR